MRPSGDEGSHSSDGRGAGGELAQGHPAPAGAPLLALGVPEMDDDHAALEMLFAAVLETPDRRLPALFLDIRAEVAAHFSREETLMRAHALPVLYCHMAQHRRILETIDDAQLMVDLLDVPALRHFLEQVLPAQVEAHVASVDRLAAAFIRGEIPAEAMAGLRVAEA